MLIVNLVYKKNQRSLSVLGLLEGSSNKKLIKKLELFIHANLIKLKSLSKNFTIIKKKVIKLKQMCFT